VHGNCPYGGSLFVGPFYDNYIIIPFSAFFKRKIIPLCQIGKSHEKSRKETGRQDNLTDTIIRPCAERLFFSGAV